MFLFALEQVKLVIFICYLFVILFVIFFSWLYLTRTARATKELGLHAPSYINLLVRISIINAIATAGLIVIFLLTSFY